VARAGQQIDGPGGVRLRFVATAAERLEIEATYPAAGFMPPPHLHPSQRERFTVLEGTMQTIIDGAERDYEAGETFEVPAGTTHQMTARGPARMRWEVAPALRTAEFFERLYGEMTDGTQSSEAITAFFAEFADEVQIAV
jgi:quercetin dioxygenase-like cupin family protein